MTLIPSKEELDTILAEYFTWKGEAIHEINKTQNYKRMKKALSDLITKHEVEAEVNRFEVIDHMGEGRVFTKWEDSNFKVKLSKQDGGRTLKVFLSELQKGIEQ